MNRGKPRANRWIVCSRSSQLLFPAHFAVRSTCNLLTMAPNNKNSNKNSKSKDNAKNKGLAVAKEKTILRISRAERTELKNKGDLRGFFWRNPDFEGGVP